MFANILCTACEYTITTLEFGSVVPLMRRRQDQKGFS